MVEILALETGDQGGFDAEERLPDPMDVMVVCSSLINFSPIDNDRGFGGYSDEDSVASFNGSRKDADKIQIRLAHFSVQEFLLSDRFVFESCLHYLFHLCQDGPCTEEHVRQYPLSVHAASQWWEHLQIIIHLINETLLELTLRFLTEVNTSLLLWVQLYGIDNLYRGLEFSVKAEDVAQPLDYAA
ncbi:hypothetical protein LTR55_011783 [Exophiala xenobiotica]|nr:hypothetical protein LTR55_011783 [Exophiala xenobiotica]